MSQNCILAIMPKINIANLWLCSLPLPLAPRLWYD